MSWHLPDLHFFLGCLQVSRRSGHHLRVHPEILQAKTAGSRAETLDREREGGRFAIATEVRRSAIAAEASAIALQSALREHEGRAAEGASKPRA
jgi:hypothetical protein